MTVATTTTTPTQLPRLRTPKRTTMMAAAVAGLAIAGIAAIAGTTGTTSPATSAPEVGVSGPVAVDHTGAASYAEALRGLSPASAAPGVVGPVAIDQSGAATHAETNGLRGLSPASAAPVAATGTGYPAGFAESVEAQLTGVPTTADGVLPRSAFASDSAWIEANGWGTTATTVDPAAVPASYVEAAEEAATGGVTESDTDGVVPRTSVATDSDWIEVNGWGPR